MEEECSNSMEFIKMECEEEFESNTLNLEAVKNSTTIKNNILSGTFKIIPKRGRSKVWEIYGRVDDGTGTEIANRVCCKICFAILKYDERSTSNLVKHKCYKNIKESETSKTEVSHEVKQEAIKLLTQWCIKNCRPIEMVSDMELIEYSEFLISLVAKFGSNIDLRKLVPHPVTVSRNIEGIYEAAIVKLKNELNTNCNYGFGLTSDIWTDNYMKKSYISLTIHYVSNGILVSRLLGLISIDEARSTNDFIRSKTEKLFKKYDCNMEEAIMVTDRDSNMVAAFDRYSHIYCISHMLNNVVEQSVTEVEEVLEQCNLCSEVVKFFQKSGENCNLSTSLKSFCSTRWYTVFYLFESIERNWQEIGKILERKNELNRIENININYIKVIVNVLRPFEQACKTLEGDKYSTLHLVYVYANGLMDNCKAANEDIKIIKNFKAVLRDNLQKTVISNVGTIHKLALFLFPPANKLLEISSEEKQLVLSDCAKELEYYLHKVKQEPTVEPPTTSNKTLMSSFFKPFVNNETTSNSSDKIMCEIQAYQNFNIPYEDNFDVLQWWNLHKSQLPLMYKLSCKILSTPASSTASERVFAMVRNLLSQNTSNSNILNQMVFLNVNDGLDNNQWHTF